MKFFRFFILGVLFLGSLFLLKNVFAAVTVPWLSSPTAIGINQTTATLGATITGQGSSAISARGTCWGTSPSPSNCLNLGGTAIGTFTQSRGGFSPNTLYYYRGYATNSSGTGYSSDGTFTTSAGSITAVVQPSPTTYITSINTSISFTYTANFNIYEYQKVTECRLLNNAYQPLTNYLRFSPIVYTSPSSSGTYAYYIQCEDTPELTTTATSSQITVNIPSLPAPVVTVKANGTNPLTVDYGTSVNITWTSQNATSCSCSYSEGSCGTSTLNNTTIQASGNPYTLAATKTFTVTCSN